ncbi:hypothetical protein G3N59_03255 [Paraburkholderia sp. Ac-20340]|uniref:hypothetical protein n=1 Tax=Paraburkholderia sp. Ac-20340 TaxID=2703888 RepID=UPI00197E44C2|nr:hypothetical protein [Paraburkholderia sp. Ac-20340]MBN3852390.1 hypothetical protein [Paraburkholderia sp. Ac-20340]
MPSCRQSDPFRAKPWLAHTPQPDDPPPDQPGTPDVPPVGDPPAQPGEVPRSVDPRFYPAMRVSPPAVAHATQAREERAQIARTAERAGRAAWARWARWVGWVGQTDPATLDASGPDQSRRDATSVAQVHRWSRA